MEDVNVVSEHSTKAIEELLRGREFANQLKQLINIGDDHDDQSATTTPFVQSLVKNVLTSFTNAFLLLNKYPTNSQSHNQVSQIQKSGYSTKSEDSQESCKTSTIKDRRGCYKRRRTTQTYEKLSKTTTGDGHQGRKYGQKLILNSKYSRHYYRCTHKFDQGCQATKQVQQVQEEPPLHKITYYGHHTCTNFLLNPEIILDSNSPPNDSSILLSFNNTFPIPTKQECPLLSPSFPTPPLEKCMEELPSISSPDDYLLSPHPTLDNAFRDDTLSSVLQSDHRDVMSGFLYDSFDLDDDVFQSISLVFDDSSGGIGCAPWAWSVGYRQVVLESDSSCVITMLTSIAATDCEGHLIYKHGFKKNGLLGYSTPIEKTTYVIQ
ncbi:probable WRKY transcription factor 67 [Gastrolobium bilobum]|uniref:probable WRKY transcription factor 67 n=1 Tax=Gastrolobium bilobum TaxID=150636 RepID=UPI002AB088C0|nr:probable WRKY transcription factor 67 [Gastrolobium bilobum]